MLLVTTNGQRPARVARAGLLFALLLGITSRMIPVHGQINDFTATEDVPSGVGEVPAVSNSDGPIVPALSGATAPGTGGCSFLTNEPRYYQVDAVVTIQNAPVDDVFVNDGLVRLLRRRLLVAPCQISLSVGTPCESGIVSLPCAEPIFACRGDGGLDSEVVVTNDVVKAVKEDLCDANNDGVVKNGELNMLVCNVVAAHPAIVPLIQQNKCTPSCPPTKLPSESKGAIEQKLVNCLSFNLLLSSPTEDGASMLMEQLLSEDIAEEVEMSLSGFGSAPLIFSVVTASVEGAVGFGYFPPPPPPPPPLKPLTPASSAKNEDLILVYGSWSSCYPSCGDGWSTRTVRCIDSEGSAAPLANCPGGLGALTSKACSTSCELPYWEYGPWQSCNQTCGKGTSIRTAKCVSDGVVNCIEDQEEELSRECNTQPCQVFAWTVTGWDQCTVSCGGGTQSRSVKCVDRDGNNVDDSNCVADARPDDQKVCNDEPCDLCVESICLGRGVCSNGACTCDEGFSGQDCQVPTTCSTGVVGSNLQCCDSGSVDLEGNCCADKDAEIDDLGACCSQGVDACGICGGKAKFIDIQGTCCETIDADGVCCDSGELDECGVCNGIGDTCNIILGVKMEVPVDIISGDSIQDEVIYNYFVEISKDSDIPASSISIGDVALAPSNGRRLLSRSMLQQVDRVTVVVEVEISPEASTSLIPFSAPYYAALLPEISTQHNNPESGISIQNVPIATRSGVCGNNICEVGERSTVGAIAGTCPEDCGIPSKTCPGGCGSGGTCIQSSGVCSCRKGYTGSSCEECSTGYLRTNDGVCMSDVAALDLISPSVLNENGEAIVSVDSGGTSAGVIVGAVFGTLAGVALIGVLIFCMRRRLGQKTPHQSTQYLDHANGGTYSSNESDEMGLRKKYGVDTYNFGYNAEDRSGMIPSAMYDAQTHEYYGQSSDHNPNGPGSGQTNGHEPSNQVMDHRSTYSFPGNGEIAGLDSGQTPLGLDRPLSAQISYVQNDHEATYLSSDQISGYYEKLYVKRGDTEDNEIFLSKGITDVANRPEYLIKSTVNRSALLKEDAANSNSMAANDAVSLENSASTGVECSDRVTKDGIETLSSLDPQSRLFYNPAFSLRGEEFPNLSCVQSVDETGNHTYPTEEEEAQNGDNVVHDDGEEVLDYMKSRKQKLEALRAAVRSLESRGHSRPSTRDSSINIYEAPDEPPRPFLDGRPSVPHLNMNIMGSRCASTLSAPPSPSGITAAQQQPIEARQARHTPPRRGFLANLGRILTPPRFRRHEGDMIQDSEAPQQSDSSFTRVMCVVDEALDQAQNQAKNARTVKRSRFNVGNCDEGNH
eukprot:jgi/Picsp_1/297/NSC_00296-R1_cre-gon-1 protein